MSFCKSKKKPDDIPTAVHNIYKYSGWVNYGDWLGTSSTSNSKIQFLNFHDAREFVRSLKINSNRNWRIYYKSKKRPKNIPTAPDKTYKNSGWISWEDWLGNTK